MFIIDQALNSISNIISSIFFPSNICLSFVMWTFIVVHQYGLKNSFKYIKQKQSTFLFFYSSERKGVATHTKDFLGQSQHVFKILFFWHYQILDDSF
jgi:hypothetical protein